MGKLHREIWKPIKTLFEMRKGEVLNVLVVLEVSMMILET